jgi:hypothetical protein
MLLDEMLQWYEAISPQNLHEIERFYSADAWFKDPFNEVNGVVDIRRIFAHMFETTQKPRFVMKDRVLQGEMAFITWDFVFELQGKAYSVHGASHLKLNAQGQVCYHRDYWDAAEELFQKLPVIGLPIRWLRRQFALKDQSKKK